MSVTAYVHWEDPNGARAQAARAINNDSECQLEVIPVDSAFGLKYGEVLYQGTDSRMFVYEHLEDRQEMPNRAWEFRAFSVWKGDPEVQEWLESQGVTINVNYL
jgi:hypothetical protein